MRRKPESKYLLQSVFSLRNWSEQNNYFFESLFIQIRSNHISEGIIGILPNISIFFTQN